ncbi:polysaccharide deacetylase family protein [Lutibacter sp.]|uniref:polysaccharide deacetylase family protein n=1 Tax=Lutibacter sp. TaxID=1925666 RepID=UPI003564CDE8
MTSTLLSLLIDCSKQNILVPFYHAVSNTVPSFIGNLYSPRNIDDFEKDLDTLLSFYEPVSLTELISIVNSNKKNTPKCFHLTFDDGLANFYEVVAPILIKRKIPATVFLNTNFVDNKELFFRYKASLLLNNYNKSSESVKEKYHKFIANNNSNSSSVSDFLLAITFQNKDILDNLALNLNFSFNDFLNTEKPYLTTNQIRELIKQGFTFGAHSENHPLYAQLSLNEQINETTNSLNWIKKEYNINYNAFSFPFTDLGVSTSFYETIKNESIVDISFGTSGIKRDLVENNLQRIPFEEAGKSAKFFLLKEYMRYFLKIPMGKSIMKRS